MSQWLSSVHTAFILELLPKYSAGLSPYLACVCTDLNPVEIGRVSSGFAYHIVSNGCNEQRILLLKALLFCCY